jgi:hypothetical protein
LCSSLVVAAPDLSEARPPHKHEHVECDTEPREPPHASAPGGSDGSAWMLRPRRSMAGSRTSLIGVANRLRNYCATPAPVSLAALFADATRPACVLAKVRRRRPCPSGKKNKISSSDARQPPLHGEVIITFAHHLRRIKAREQPASQIKSQPTLSYDTTW